MNEWIDALADHAAAGDAAVIVTVVAVRGSAPREPGAKMLVLERETVGTIGGGQLEYECTRIAVARLGGDAAPELRSFPLGAAMGQCCGGVVDVLFESVSAGPDRWLRDLKALHGQREAAALVTAIRDTGKKYVLTADAEFGPEPLPRDARETARQLLVAGGATCHDEAFLYEPVVASSFNIAVFGAGHVGSAVVDALSRLDCNLRWVDNRRRVFRSVPANVRAIEAAEPALEVAAMPGASFFLVMTHSHALDFDVCDRVLRRGDAAYCGLIGSRTKRRRFEKRFRSQGMSDRVLGGLTCPIGVDGISGKKPVEIAVAVAAELLQARERDSAASRLPANVHPLSR